MQLRYIIYTVILLCSGCVTSKPQLTPEMTELREEQKDWIVIYQEEINVAIMNEDMWAIIFFNDELKREYKRLGQLKKSDR